MFERTSVWRPMEPFRAPAWDNNNNNNNYIFEQINVCISGPSCRPAGVIVRFDVRVQVLA